MIALVTLTVVGLLLMGLAFCFFMLCRNEAVYAVRSAFIDRGDDFLYYSKLPKYEAMLDSPKYWLLWTPAHWEAWVARQSVAAQSQEA